MQKRWIALVLVMGLLLAGCGKSKKDQEDHYEKPNLTEAPTYETVPPIVDNMEEMMEPAETTEPVTEATVAPTEAPTEPKEDPNQKPVNETVYAVAKVNVRNAGGFNSAVIGELKAGDKVTRTGIGTNGWSRIIYDGKTAYVANNYVTTDSPEKAGGAVFDEVSQTVRATAKVNIRKGPSVEYEVIGALQAGEQVKRTAIGSKGWSRIEWDGKTCYVSNNYLKTVSEDKVKEDPKPAQTEEKLEPVG